MTGVQRRKIDLVATVFCLSALGCWSTGPLFIKYLTSYVDFWTQNLLRYSTACLFWLPFLMLCVRRGKVPSGLWRSAIAPAVANVVMQCFWAASFYYIEPAFMNLLVKSSVVWIAVFSVIFFADERPLVRSWRFWVSLLLCVVGVSGVLVFEESFGQRQTTLGVILAMTTAFMWAVYTVLVRATFRQTDSRLGFAVVSIYTVLALAVVAAMFGEVSESLKMGTWQWMCVLISGLVAIAFSHVFYYSSMRRIGATIPSLVLLASPFTILAASSVIFGERLGGIQLLFGLVLIAGAALAIWTQEHLGTIHTQD